MALEPNDKPITHEDHLFDNGRVYGGNLREDCEAVRSEYYQPAVKTREDKAEISKYLIATQDEFNALCGKCFAGGERLSFYQQRVISYFLASVYQDGMIAVLREQTDKQVKS